MKYKNNLSSKFQTDYSSASAEKIAISNPISSKKLMLIDENGKKTLTISEIVRNKNRKLDKEQILYQIAYNGEPHKSSYWEKLSILPPGCTYTHNLTNNKSVTASHLLEFKTKLTDKTHDPFEILIQCIRESQQSCRYDNLVVRLSGGVDSTCILLAAIEVMEPNQIIAITWADTNSSANRDLIAATELCKKFCIKQIVFRFEPEYFFQEVLPQDHVYINVGMATDKIFEKEKEFISSSVDGSYLVLDGHGGDHMFLDPVPAVAYQHALKNHQIFRAVKTLVMISKLNGASLYETLSNSRRQENYDRTQRKALFTAPLIQSHKTIKPETMDAESARIVAQAIYQNATTQTLNRGLNILHPFTCQPMIEYAIRQDPYRMFNEHNSRVLLRRAVNQKYPSVNLRSDKGHITSAYQNALRHHEDRILSTLTSSWLAKDKIINMPYIETAIRHSSLGFGGVDQTLLKIICTSLIKET